MEKELPGLYIGPGGTRLPIPDPTLLTTVAVTREIAALREIIETRIAAMDKAQALFHDDISRVPTDMDRLIIQLKEVYEGRFGAIEASIGNRLLAVAERLDSSDKAVRLLQAIEDKWPVRVDEKIIALRAIHEEKFSSIQRQFQERDTRTEQSSKDSKVAVDAALQAAKEAVGEQNKSSGSAIAKSEAATSKQIDQIMQLIQTGNKAMDDKITDAKERLTRIEGKGEGAGATNQSYVEQHRSNMALIVSIVFGILAFGVAVAAFFKHP